MRADEPTPKARSEKRSEISDEAAGNGSTRCCPHSPVRPQDSPQPLVSVSGLEVRRGGRVLIHEVDLNIEPREIVTLVGPNGAGKTTLVRALLGLESSVRGTVWRRPGLRIGYVPQRFATDLALPMTVKRFLELGVGQGALSATLPALDEVGARHVLSRPLTALSGGELQRVLLARALLRDPQLLVLDEPARGVDYTGEAELYTLIGRLRDERHLGVLLVSHDLHIVMAQSDRVICLNGHICCQGVPHAVARHPEYMRLFGPEIARTLAVYQHRHDHRHDHESPPKSS